MSKNELPWAFNNRETAAALIEETTENNANIEALFGETFGTTLASVDSVSGALDAEYNQQIGSEQSETLVGETIDADPSTAALIGETTSFQRLYALHIIAKKIPKPSG